MILVGNGRDPAGILNVHVGLSCSVEDRQAGIPQLPRVRQASSLLSVTGQASSLLGVTGSPQKRGWLSASQRQR